MSSELEAALDALTTELDAAGPAVRTSQEWRDARDLVFEFRKLLPPFTPSEREDRERRVATARDLLLLAQERADRAEEDNQRERDRRAREDKAHIDHARERLRAYTGQVGWTFVLGILLGFFAGPLVVLAPLPGVFGARAMRATLAAGQGRIWLLHRGDWDTIERQARLHDAAAAALSVVCGLAFLLRVAPWGSR